MHKANLGSQLSIFYMGSFARMTRPNELTQTPLNELPEQIYMGARMTETK